MKRTHSPSPGSNKRHKISSYSSYGGFLYEGVTQNPSEFRKNGLDASKCIGGQFKVIQHGLDGGIRTIVAIPKGDGKFDTFSVVFRLTQTLLDELEIKPTQHFRLSLQGAQLEKLKEPAKLCNLPVQLVYSNGICMEWWQPGKENEMQTVNTWISPDTEEASEDILDPDNSWFPTPQKSRTSVASSDGDQDVDSDAVESPQRLKDRPRQAQSSGSAKRTSPPTSPPPPPGRRARRMEARRRRLEQELDSKSATDEPPSPKKTSTTKKHAIINEPPVSSPPKSSQFVCGLRTPLVYYSPVKEPTMSAVLNFIGIVLSTPSPSQTRTGDWSCSFDIVDPSRYLPGLDWRYQGIKVNCFVKRYVEWLPQCEIGDVIVLQSVKITDWKGTARATGYHGRLQWAAYSASQGRVLQPALNNAPPADHLGHDGGGYLFSPFLDLGQEEIDYCIRLSDWWRDIFENAQTSGGLLPPLPTKRVHRLMKDASPTAPPNGYFDCTVEIIRGFPGNLQQVYSIYATDYTKNSGFPIISREWCHSDLTEYVIPMEFWDKSADFARKMEWGGYYHIKNARMRVDGLGCLAVKVADAKITQLDEEGDSSHLCLKDLLKRKRAFESKQHKKEPDFEYKVIEKLEENQFFHCVVEVLHIKGDHIYITDYTYHPKLQQTPSDEPWAHGLEGKVLPILLTDGQQAFAESFSLGSYCNIKNLRVKYAASERCFCGRLGGREKLITPLNVNSQTSNPHLNALLRRKEAWAAKPSRPEEAPPKVQASPSRVAAPVSVPFPKMKGDYLASVRRIRDIPPEGKLNFSIIGRVKDFYPLKLEDAFILVCKKCSKMLSGNVKGCVECGDFEHEYLEHEYRILLDIEDQDGQSIVVSVNDESNLLKNLKCTDFSQDQDALKELKTRLRPIIGNLTLVHNAMLADKKAEVNTPLLTFHIHSWIVKKLNKRAFSLLDFAPP